jgi:hypothetical protein
MNFEYKAKYLKYKDKYLELKNDLIGGECNPVPILTDIESISQENYGSRNSNQRITIAGDCYFINEIYNWIFTQNLPYSMNPKMTSPLNRSAITRSELERLIVAYFEQNPIGPFIRPGYPTLDDMITRARNIAIQDIVPAAEVIRITGLTNDIIATGVERERLERERLDRERRERLERERLERELERERLERVRLERELERERLERVRIERELERLKRELERERLERERVRPESDRERVRPESDRERQERQERIFRQGLEERITRNEIDRFINHQITGTIHDDIKILERIKILVNHRDVSNAGDLWRLMDKSSEIRNKYNNTSNVQPELIKYAEELYGNIAYTIRGRVGS